MSTVALTCEVASNDTSSFTVASFYWKNEECYTNSIFTHNSPECFPHDRTTEKSTGQTSQKVTRNNLNVEDAGTITCTVTIEANNYTSQPFTLCISGKKILYCVIPCIVHCKQYIIIGIAFIHNESTSDDALTDYSYINIRSGGSNCNVRIAGCMTGLAPNGNNSGVLGGLYFNGNRIPNREACSSAIIQPIPSTDKAGIININQCGLFSTAAEGVYTCVMMNNAMLNESVRFGVYFTGRSESLNSHTASHHLTTFHSPCMQLLQ